MQKKIISKKEFIFKNFSTSKNLFSKKKYFNLYKNFLVQTLKKRLALQTTWLGEPILQLPQDLLIFQELIYKNKTDYFIECGVAWSGSLLFIATIFNVIGGKKIIGIDSFIPSNVYIAVNKNKKLKKKIKLINGISTNEKVIKRVKKIVKGSKKIIVHLDSDHSQENVLKELNSFAKIIKKGSFIVCGDTHIEFFKNNLHGKNKNYSKGNNPMTALKIFLKTKLGKKFKQDFTYHDRYLLTLNPFGILKKIKN